jgi:hypothetical protein
MAQVEILLAPLRGVTRARALRTGVAVVVVVAVGLFGVEYWQARAHLRDVRHQLAQTRTTLSDTETELDTTRAESASAHDGIDLVKGNTDHEVASRQLLDKAARDSLSQAAFVDASRMQADLARLAVAANANETRACFDGVASAVAANRGGDGRTAVTALRGASGACARTLARATGARFPYDFADPYVLKSGHAYYGYSTNAGAGDIQVIRSTDLVTWTLLGNGLAGLPRWAASDATWAPSVLPRGGGFVAYYTVRERASGQQCVSRAVASSPAGPFRDDSTGPLVCQRPRGGSIDPSPFVDSGGRAYLLWKSESGAGGPATLWAQQLSSDGLTRTGPAKPLVTADRPFERGVVEGPTMVRAGGHYFLLYAAGPWSSGRYSTAYAVCAGPLGPCLKPPGSSGRLLASGPHLAGPGGAEVFRSAGGSYWVAFHAYSAPNIGYPASRYLHIGRLVVAGGRIVIDTTT